MITLTLAAFDLLMSTSEPQAEHITLARGLAQDLRDGRPFSADFQPDDLDRHPLCQLLRQLSRAETGAWAGALIELIQEVELRSQPIGPELGHRGTQILLAEVCLTNVWQWWLDCYPKALEAISAEQLSGWLFDVLDRNMVPSWTESQQEARLQILLEAGADPNALNYKGGLPLSSLVEPDLMDRLFQAGADKTLRDSQGRSPLRALLDDDVAGGYSEERQSDLVQRLLTPGWSRDVLGCLDRINPALWDRISPTWKTDLVEGRCIVEWALLAALGRLTAEHETVNQARRILEGGFRREVAVAHQPHLRLVTQGPRAVCPPERAWAVAAASDLVAMQTQDWTPWAELEGPELGARLDRLGRWLDSACEPRREGEAPVLSSGGSSLAKEVLGGCYAHWDQCVDALASNEAGTETARLWEWLYRMGGFISVGDSWSTIFKDPDTGQEINVLRTQGIELGAWGSAADEVRTLQRWADMWDRVPDRKWPENVSALVMWLCVVAEEASKKQIFDWVTSNQMPSAWWENATTAVQDFDDGVNDEGKTHWPCQMNAFFKAKLRAHRTPAVEEPSSASRVKVRT